MGHVHLNQCLHIVFDKAIIMDEMKMDELERQASQERQVCLPWCHGQCIICPANELCMLPFNTQLHQH